MRRNLARYHVGHGYFPVIADPVPGGRASMGLFRDLATITSHAQDRACTCFPAGSPGSAAGELDCGRYLANREWPARRALGRDPGRDDARSPEKWLANVRGQVSGLNE